MLSDAGCVAAIQVIHMLLWDEEGINFSKKENYFSQLFFFFFFPICGLSAMMQLLYSEFKLTIDLLFLVSFHKWQVDSYRSWKKMAFQSPGHHMVHKSFLLCHTLFRAVGNRGKGWMRPSLLLPITRHCAMTRFQRAMSQQATWELWLSFQAL